VAAQTIAFLILLPFTLAFIYAGIHEYLRYKSEGRATYGLVYDQDTGKTHITGIPEGEEAYDPEEFDPDDFNNAESSETPDKDKT
jgi:hypothetical protein